MYLCFDLYIFGTKYENICRYVNIDMQIQRYVGQDCRFRFVYIDFDLDVGLDLDKDVGSVKLF